MDDEDDSVVPRKNGGKRSPLSPAQLAEQRKYERLQGRLHESNAKYAGVETPAQKAFPNRCSRRATDAEYRCHRNKAQQDWFERKSEDPDWLERHKGAQKQAYRLFHDKHPDAASIATTNAKGRNAEAIQ